MKKYTSFILAIILTLWSFLSGVGTADAKEVSTPTAVPSVRVKQPFETPTDLGAFGDVNDDGIINAKDALAVLAYTVGKPSPQQAAEEFILLADVDEDGAVTVSDALEILKYSVGKPADFPNTLAVSSLAAKTVVNLGSVAMPDYLETNNKAYVNAFNTLAARQQIGTYAKPLGEEDLVDTIVKNAKAGKSEYDVLEVSPAVVFKAAKKNAIADLKGSTTLDLSLFHSGATEFMTLGGTLYGVASKATVNEPLLFFYNRDMAHSVAPETDIAALVKEYKWNVTAFTEFLSKAVLVNEEGRKVRWGFTGGVETTEQLMLATGGAMAFKQDGKVVASGLENRFAEGLGLACRLYKVDKSWRYLNTREKRMDSFAKGESMGMFATANQAQSLQNAVAFSLGVAPLPLGENQTEYASVHSASRVYAVPKDKEYRLDPIGEWLNATAKVEGKHRNNRIVALLRVDPQSGAGQWYGELLKNADLDYANGVLSYGITSQIQAAIHSKNSYKILPAIQAAVNKEIEDFYGSFYE